MNIGSFDLGIRIMPMKKIAIHGFYGQGNLGDEAILMALLREFNKLPELRITVFSTRPEEVSKLHKVKSIHSRRTREFLRRIYEIKRSNLFILGGGGLLKDYGATSANIKRWLELLILAQKLKTKTALCAVGVENIHYPESKRLIRNTLNKTNLITVRDNISKKILQQVGVAREIKVTTDPAVLLNPEPLKTKKLIGPPKIIVCIRHWYDKGFYIANPEVNKNFIKSLSITADFLIENYGASIDFVPFRTTSYDDDRIIAKQVLSYMKYRGKAHIYSCVPEVNEFIKMARQSSLVIGMRLHSLILGTSVGVPVIGLEYMPKVRGYMESIDQGKYSLPLGTLTSNKLIQLIKTTLEQYQPRSQTIISNVSKLQSIAKHGIKEIIDLAG